MNPPPPVRPGHCRRVLCAWLWAATTLDYLERQIFGRLATERQRDIGGREIA